MKKNQPKWIKELIKEFGLDPKKTLIDVALMIDDKNKKSFFGDIYITVTNKRIKNANTSKTND